jgi:hypothetical protein
LREGVAGLVVVRHERALIRLPVNLSASQAVELAQSLAVSLVAQPLEVRPGKELPIFRVPVGEAGMLLEAAVGAVPATQVPLTSLTFTDVVLWQEGQRYCLGFDYRLNTNSAQEVFRLQSPVPDAWVSSASTQFERKEGGGGLPRVTYRATVGLPALMDEKGARQLQETNRTLWVGRTLTLRAGERQDLFSWAMTNQKPLQVTVESRLPDVHSTR